MDKKFDLLKEDLKRDMIAELREIVHKQNDKIDVLENSVCMLQQQIESRSLTTSRYILWRKAIDLVENKENVKFVYADINCRLKVRFENDTEQFFSTISELERIISI